MTTRRLVLSGACAAAVLVMLVPSDARGTIEEQRARLPPPAECADAVEGVWLALHYGQSWGEWYEYTLNVRRVAEGSPRLRGDMLSHYWYGSRSDEKPPPCRPGGFEALIRLPDASGEIIGQKIDLGASTWSEDRLLCGASHGYNPDHFSGTIDPSRQEFQSVNNDGGKAINDPVVFRRVKCFDPPRKAPEKNVTPPAFAPAERRASCTR